jgi:hypothetical protein
MPFATGEWHTLNGAGAEPGAPLCRECVGTGKNNTKQELDKGFPNKYSIKSGNKYRIYLDNCSFNRP